MVLFVMRESPSDLGLTPPGGLLSDTTGAAFDSAEGMRYTDALATRNFRILAFIAMLTFYSVLALLTHLFLHMRAQGFDPQIAASGLSVLFLLGLAGKLASGLLADLLGGKVVFVGTLGIMCACSWLLTSTKEAAR